MKAVLRIATEALPRSRRLQPEGVGADSLQPLRRFKGQPRPVSTSEADRDAK